MKQYDNDFMSADELEVLSDDLNQLINDSDTRVAITYHSSGTVTFDETTGQEDEVGGVNDPVYGFRTKPSDKAVAEQGEQADLDAYLLFAADLTNEPKTNDYITVGSVRKYVLRVDRSGLGLHYRVTVASKGEA